MVVRNYRDCISKEVMGNDGFTDAGFIDGYADLENDAKNILFQLYGLALEDDLITYLTNYLNGYEIGEFMSKESEVIYDEDGNLKEPEYSLDPCESRNKAIALGLVNKYKT